MGKITADTAWALSGIGEDILRDVGVALFDFHVEEIPRAPQASPHPKQTLVQNSDPPGSSSISYLSTSSE